MKSISIFSLFVILLSYFSRAEVFKFNDLNFDKQVNSILFYSILFFK